MFREETPAKLAHKVELSEPARTLVSALRTPEEGVRKLLEAGHFEDVPLFLGVALQRREAVWWACQCVRKTLLPTDSPAERAALEAAERWVECQGETERRAAFEAARKLDYATAAAFASLAAFWSGGSIAPPGAPDVPPGENLLPTAARATFLLAAARAPALEQKATREAMVRLGLEIGQGTKRLPGREKPGGSASPPPAAVVPERRHVPGSARIPPPPPR